MVSSLLATSTPGTQIRAYIAELKRLLLPLDTGKGLSQALGYPGIRRLELTPEIGVASTQLKNFHRDPPDQIIVATARV